MKVAYSSSILLALGAPSPSKAFVSQSPAFSRRSRSRTATESSSSSSSALASTQAGTSASSYEEALSSYTQGVGAGTMQQQQQQQQRQQQASTASPARTAGSPQVPPKQQQQQQQQQTSMPAPITVQGGSLKTWSLQSAAVERVEVMLQTEGRPLDADIDLWHGPDNTPNKMRVYVEDGSTRPFHAVVETPRGPNTVAIRNIGQLEFPMMAQVMPNPTDNASTTAVTSLDAPKIIQGGALKTYSFDANVESVQLLLRTDGRPMNARIELLQGPNNIKQVMELYIEDGMDRPFYAIVKTPGSGNVVRIVNTSPVEFPMTASIGPHSVGNVEFNGSADMVLGGDGKEFGARDLQW